MDSNLSATEDQLSRDSDSLVIYVADSWPACHEFEPKAAEHSPCREVKKPEHVKYVESSNVLPLGWCGVAKQLMRAKAAYCAYLSLRDIRRWGAGADVSVKWSV
ncbi:hypothetical protein TNCV_1129111 [Trichonephila clavipes]|nr:hypothetical protein TNCV_1129111 [Trichonephila clavipes]